MVPWGVTVTAAGAGLGAGVGVEVLAGAGVDGPAAVGDEAVVVEAGLEPAVAACVAAGRFGFRAGDAER